MEEGKGVELQSIAVKVEANDSGCISIGLGLLEIFKAKNYKVEGT